MNPEIKEKWLSALRSGEYLHGKETLKNRGPMGVRHCCLGVLCEIHMQETNDGKWTSDGYYEVLSDRSSSMKILPTGVQKWAGIDSTGSIESHGALTLVNDKIETKDFSEVISLIEQYL